MMLMSRILTVVATIAAVTAVDVKLRKRSTLYLPYSYASGAPHYEIKKIAVEQITYDPSAKILYTVGDLVLHAIDVSDPDNMRILSYLEYPGMEFTDVEFCGGHVFAALDNHTDRAEGKAMVFTGHDRSTNQMKEILRVPVGAVPDMVKPTSDCTKLVVAVEGEAYEYPPDHITDPPGYVVIVNFPWGVNNNYIISTLGFSLFNNRVESLRPSGVRHVYQENNNPFSNDVEPEYVAISPDNSIAYVVLQENNAVARIDLQTQTISEIHGLGYKDFNKSKFDPSDRDGGHVLNSYAVSGMYQPDAIVHFQFNGENYLAMANEGDAKDYEYGAYQWSEESRGSTIPLLGEVSNERPGIIFVYSLDDDVTQPKFQDIYTGIPQTRGKTWQQMYQERVLSEIDCEDLKFISASDSPTGKPILFAAASMSGTVSIIDIDVTGS